MRPGDTFITASPGTEVEHLWIVVTKPGSDGTAVCVNVTSAENSPDGTTQIEPGEHPFITHSSVVEYRRAKIVDIKGVEKILDDGDEAPIRIERHKPCSSELMKRVRKGILGSEYTSNKIKAAVCDGA
jgi:hypothetical protein